MRGRARVRRPIVGVGLSLALMAALVVGQEAHERAGSPVAGMYSRTVPIAVPAFRGLEPRLALAYSSTMENGFAGVGWSLQGFATVKRVSAGMGTARFDAADIHLLGGAELLPCPQTGGGASCAAGGSHFTKDESYVRVRFDAGSNRWSATAPDGTRTRFDALDSTPSGTVLWGQAEVVDPLGNAVIYQWSCAQGECYPAAVQFGPYAVTVYREARPDRVSHASGRATDMREMRDRLRSVLVARQGQPIRAYKLGYDVSVGTGRSRLAAVTTFGRDVAIDASGSITGGTSLPAESFEYQDDPSTRSFARRFGERSTVYATAYAVGTWGSCAGSGGWSCSSADSNGCSRGGTQARTATPTAWTTSASEAVAPPATTQGCTETTQGFVSAYAVSGWGACSGSAGWSCISTAWNGCSRGGTQTRTASASAWTASSSQAASPPATSQGCTETAQGYVASYSLGGWSSCSSSCGGGSQSRDVSPASYTASAPGASAPDSIQSCTGTSCTCDDMGWFAADAKGQCDSECGASCTKKQWCGYNTCEPWPNYCWKC